MNNSHGFILWFTGLSGAGKTAIGEALLKRLKKEGHYRTEHLDGDIVRKDLTKDLGFSKEDREENLNRVSYVSSLLSRNGVGVIVTFISPYIESRQRIRKKLDNYIEVFINTPLEVCENNDVKGLYKKARAREILNFTGVSDRYDTPINPEIEINTTKKSIDESVDTIYDYLIENNYVSKKL